MMDQREILLEEAICLTKDIEVNGIGAARIALVLEKLAQIKSMMTIRAEDIPTRPWTHDESDFGDYDDE